MLVSQEYLGINDIFCTLVLVMSYVCVCAHKRRRIFGHTRHILEAGGRDREQIKNRSPLHQSVGLETRGGKLVDEELGEGGGG